MIHCTLMQRFIALNSASGQYNDNRGMIAFLFKFFYCVFNQSYLAFDNACGHCVLCVFRKIHQFS